MDESQNIDKLVSIWQLKRHISSERYNSLLEDLGPDELKHLKRLDSSLEKEDEFILICKLCGKCISIEKVNQSKSNLSNKSIAPDLIAVFKKELDTPDDDFEHQLSAFIEIKRCYHRIWKISKQDFDARLRYASRHGKQIFFAIDFAYDGAPGWALFSSSYIRQNGYKIGIEDLKESLFDALTGNLSILFNEFEAEFVYRRNGQQKNVVHPDYGSLEEVNIRIQDNSYSILLETALPMVVVLNNLISGTQQDVIKVNDTTRIRKRYSTIVANMYYLVLVILRAMHHDDALFCASRYLANVEEPEIDHRFGYTIVEVLEELGLAQSFIMLPHSSFETKAVKSK